MSSGNYSVAGNLTVSGNVILGGSLLTQPFTVGSFGNVLIQGGADSTNLFTGALQIIGGAALTANCYVGGNIRTTNTMAATSAVTGAIICGGGVGIGGNVFAGGNVVTTNTAHATSAVTGAIICGGGVGIGGNIYAGGNVVITNTAHATSAVTGAIICGGGVGVVGNVYVGGNIRITNSAAASSTSTGALIVSGGAGVAGSLYVGSNLVFSNANVGSYVPSPLSYYEELLHTMTWQWGSSQNTSTVLITRIGRLVTITFNSSIIVGTGGVAIPGNYVCYSQNFPARFAPTTSVNVACNIPIYNGSTFVMGCASMNQNPTIYLNTGLYHNSGSGTAIAGTIIIGNNEHIHSITYTLF